ncbi:Ubiquinone biosynthesis O-methyltransferase, mitochondrial [Methylobacterium crusticola]|uniref:Ubiquinone biosynthesis O-methyltransferase, mitochondrial n=1 Tax=Methylobacterium crusticola TaxID=1697972 RepID=A0ABQ4QQG8_9HYPH|nr:class I SAM-dependent methyltransferase [Methylobacterium crusticola]GJD47447.1 Ubiquinone biosynthesis O-methyltransferase, mitochondrial [Methylobacterium crusticola]
MVPFLDLVEPATAATFSEAAYLAANPDVHLAVRTGRLASGRAHFDRHGQRQGRRQRRRPEGLEAMMAAKLDRLAPHMRDDLPHRRIGPKYDYLSDALRELAGADETANVSQNAYDGHAEELIAAYPDGLVLDCGAGRRERYYANVVNLEIVDYDTTDVLGIGEVLPFRDASFDAVISIAVLEHVRDPFACAREIARVLKPGGRLVCAVPFLQPLHGYPHHYYNMTGEGLRNLFERHLAVDHQYVPASLLPIWSLTWMVQSWAAGLPPEARKRFLSRRLSDFAVDPLTLLDQPYVRQLSDEKNLELASGTYLFAHKE